MESHSQTTAQIPGSPQQSDQGASQAPATPGVGLGLARSGSLENLLEMKRPKSRSRLSESNPCVFPRSPGDRHAQEVRQAPRWWSLLPRDGGLSIRLRPAGRGQPPCPNRATLPRRSVGPGTCRAVPWPFDPGRAAGTQ